MEEILLLINEKRKIIINDNYQLALADLKFQAMNYPSKSLYHIHSGCINIDITKELQQRFIKEGVDTKLEFTPSGEYYLCVTIPFGYNLQTKKVLGTKNPNKCKRSFITITAKKAHPNDNKLFLTIKNNSTDKYVSMLNINLKNISGELESEHDLFLMINKHNLVFDAIQIRPQEVIGCTIDYPKELNGVFSIPFHYKEINTNFLIHRIVTVQL